MARQTPSNVDPFEPPDALLPPNGLFEVEVIQTDVREYLFQFTFTRASDGQVFFDAFVVVEPGNGWPYPGWLASNGARNQVRGRLNRMASGV